MSDRSHRRQVRQLHRFIGPADHFFLESPPHPTSRNDSLFDPDPLVSRHSPCLPFDTEFPNRPFILTTPPLASCSKARKRSIPPPNPPKGQKILESGPAFLLRWERRGFAGLGESDGRDAQTPCVGAGRACVLSRDPCYIGEVVSLGSNPPIGPFQRFRVVHVTHEGRAFRIGMQLDY